MTSLFAYVQASQPEDEAARSEDFDDADEMATSEGGAESLPGEADQQGSAAAAVDGDRDYTAEEMDDPTVDWDDDDDDLMAASSMGTGSQDASAEPRESLTTFGSVTTTDASEDEWDSDWERSENPSSTSGDESSD